MVALTCGLPLLAGCASIHLMDMVNPAPQTASASAANPVAADTDAGSITGSVAPAKALGYGAGDQSDWELIRKTVAASLSSPVTARIEWANQSTGDTGTISELTVAGAAGRDCRSFASTIAAVNGVRLYHAEICRGVMNTWEFSKIAAADAG
jgi:hypothetical protein